MIVAPKLNGNKCPTTVYLDPVTYIKMEAARGDVKKSTYIEGLIKKAVD